MINDQSGCESCVGKPNSKQVKEPAAPLLLYYKEWCGERDSPFNWYKIWRGDMVENFVKYCIKRERKRGAP